MAQKRMQFEPYKAKKCIFHAIRYIIFALQVVEHGRIIDYSAANHYLKDILEYPSSEWEDLKAAFQKPIFIKLRDELFGKVRYHELYSRMEMDTEVYAHLFNTRDKLRFLGSDIRSLDTMSKQPVGETDAAGALEIVRYLRDHDLQSLRDLFKIRVLPHSNYAHIIHLSPTVHH